MPIKLNAIGLPLQFIPNLQYLYLYFISLQISLLLIDYLKMLCFRRCFQLA